MRIIYSCGKTSPNQIEEEIKELMEYGYHITQINHNKFSQPDLCKKIKELSKTHDILLVNYNNPYKNEFIKSLNNI